MANTEPQQGAPPSHGGLAVAGLILACLFFVPLLPLIGALLGIIALATAGKQRKTGVALAATIVGLVIGLGGGCMAAVAIPAFMKYVKRSKTVEATMNLRRLSDRAVAHYQMEHAGPSGEILPRSFPRPIDWTPPTSACGNPGNKFPPNPALWSAPTWVSLDFSIDDPSYFQYRVQSTGDGSHVGDTLTLEARGDQDCDGVFSLFQRTLTVGADHELGRGSGLFTKDEME